MLTPPTKLYRRPQFLDYSSCNYFLLLKSFLFLKVHDFRLGFSSFFSFRLQITNYDGSLSNFLVKSNIFGQGILENRPVLVRRSCGNFLENSAKKFLKRVPKNQCIELKVLLLFLEKIKK